MDLYANIRPVIGVSFMASPPNPYLNSCLGIEFSITSSGPGSREREYRMSRKCVCNSPCSILRYFQYVKQETIEDTPEGKRAKATRVITERASRRIAEMAFKLASGRPRKASLLFPYPI